MAEAARRRGGEKRRVAILPSVDVVVPSYQYGRYLRGCVQSVLRQDVAPLRVLVVDNASADDSLDVARQLAAEDPRVEVVAHRTNLGPHASFNEGVDWAAADYFLILCVDDLLAPGALARATAAMEAHPNVHLTYGGVLHTTSTDPNPPVVDPTPEPARWRVMPGRKLLETFCRTGRNHVHGPTAVVRTSVQKAVGHYRPELRQTDDMEVWMRFARLGDVAETDAVQAIGRVHPQSQSAASRDVLEWDREFLAAFETFFAHDGASLADADWLLNLARRSLSERAYWGAMAQFFRREPRLGWGLLKFALSHCPDMAVAPPLGHLLRRQDSRERIKAVLAQALAPLRRRGVREI